jgi:hypothetical protein
VKEKAKDFLKNEVNFARELAEISSDPSKRFEFAKAELSVLVDEGENGKLDFGLGVCSSF